MASRSNDKFGNGIPGEVSEPKDIRLLGRRELAHIFWWLITFQSRKVTAYYYYNKVAGMIDLFAYRRAKNVTKQEYKTILAKIKEQQLKEKYKKHEIS